MKINKGLMIVVGMFVSLLALKPIQASANEMQEQVIDVFINENGSATITENRQMTMDDGTELFISFGNLDPEEVLNFHVEGYEELADWDSVDDLDEKAGYYTVLEENGVELVWGISEYGDQTYNLEYTIDNVVKNLTDGQGLLWNFNSSPEIPPQNLTVTVQTAFDFDQDMVNFWAFGLEGEITLEDGAIVLESRDASDRAVILMQFDDNLFSPTENLDQTLEEQREMAMEGSTYQDQSSILPLVVVGVVTGSLGVVGLGGGYGYYRFNKKRQQHGHIQSSSEIRKRNKDKKRSEPPVVSDPAVIFYLLNHIYKSIGFVDIFQAYLVKWMKEEKIDLSYQKESKLFGDKLETRLTIIDFDQSRGQSDFERLHDQLDQERYEGDYETLMWSIIQASADSSGIVTDKQVEKWAKNNADKMETFADYLEDYSKDALVEADYFTQDEMTFLGGKVELIVPSSSGEDLIDQLVQHKQYLEAVEVEEMANEDVSDEAAYTYILWSILLGQAKDLQKGLDDITPKSFSSEDAVNVFIFYYYFGPFGFRGNYSSGLESGGFQPTSSAAGSGGATSVGGGGGAGGATGGGAR